MAAGRAVEGAARPRRVEAVVEHLRPTSGGHHEGHGEMPLDLRRTQLRTGGDRMYLRVLRLAARARRRVEVVVVVEVFLRRRGRAALEDVRGLEILVGRATARGRTLRGLFLLPLREGSVGVRRERQGAADRPRRSVRTRLASHVHHRAPDHDAGLLLLAVGVRLRQLRLLPPPRGLLLSLLLRLLLLLLDPPSGAEVVGVRVSPRSLLLLLLLPLGVVHRRSLGATTPRGTLPRGPRGRRGALEEDLL
mmetsp:Transcript_29039/g.93638  ORF Transcript_29039/g.93638 Transcript_29039/m.93638 type:complete len:249 (-) Transcript_29039:890-1636(-)